MPTPSVSPIVGLPKLVLVHTGALRLRSTFTLITAVDTWGGLPLSCARMRTYINKKIIFELDFRKRKYQCLVEQVIMEDRKFHLIHFLIIHRKSNSIFLNKLFLMFVIIQRLEYCTVISHLRHICQRVRTLISWYLNLFFLFENAQI